MITADPQALIDYRFLNVIEKKFYPTQSELATSLKYVDGAKLISVHNDHNQILIAGGKSNISQCYAVIICRRLCHQTPRR